MNMHYLFFLSIQNNHNTLFYEYFQKKRHRFRYFYEIRENLRWLKKQMVSTQDPLLYQDLVDHIRENTKTPRGRFELPRREAPVAFEATAFPG
jgi:hypothetical protein